MSYKLLDATTSAAQSTNIIVSNRDNEWLNLSAVPILSGSEVADVQKLHGGAWVNTGKQLTASSNDLAVTGVGIYQVSKGVTATATAIYASVPASP